MPPLRYTEWLETELRQAHAERDGARADRAVATEDFLRIKAERDEWKREAIHHSELGFAADAANQALRNDLAKAVEGLRELGHMPIEPHQRVADYAIAIHNRAHSILAEIENDG